jgi:hypothetical protein
MNSNWKRVSGIFRPGKVLAGLLVVLFIISITASVGMAEDLSEAQQAALDRESVPTYPGAFFLTSDDRDEKLVLWFQSSDSPEKIMVWYRQQLPAWSVLKTQNGQTVIYKGPAGLEAKQIPDKPYIFTRLTTESEPVASEITVKLSKKQ